MCPDVSRIELMSPCSKPLATERMVVNAITPKLTPAMERSVCLKRKERPRAANRRDGLNENIQIPRKEL